MCKSAKSSVVHNIEQEADQEKENHIDTVDINSINFNNNHSVIAVDLKTSSGKIMKSYKVDTGSDGNVILLYTKSYFLGKQKSSWWQQEIQISI